VVANNEYEPDGGPTEQLVARLVDILLERTYGEETPFVLILKMDGGKVRHISNQENLKGLKKMLLEVAGEIDN
jgi:hypothetical protein|tara:strand:- start:24 stop:242 length:219 start_codon:yes stop_codon:yes gene_type:complete